MKCFTGKNLKSFSKSNFFLPSRALFQSNKNRDEIVLTNNSGIFFALASIKEHGENSHPKLKIIKTPFWLDKIDKRHHQLFWGQRINALPWYVRNIAAKKFPESHRRNDRLTWGQYIQLVNSAEEELLKLEIKLYKGDTAIIKEKSRFKIIVNKENLFVPHDSYFYNWSKIQNCNHRIEDVIGVPHSDMYFLEEKNELKTAIVVGSGRSVVWLAKHFPNTVFACIKRRGKDLPIYEHEREKTRNIIQQYDYNDFIGTNSKFLFAKPKNFQNQLIIVERSSKKTQFVASDFKLYCAMGLTPDYELTKIIPRRQTLIPYKESWSWVASERELPQGSLTESCARWARLTQNELWTVEFFAYHDSATAEFLAKKIEERIEETGFSLSNHFFLLLKEKLLKSKCVPPQEELNNILLECYRSSGGEDIERFKESLTVCSNENNSRLIK